MRPTAKGTLVAAINISIHAPLAGCDKNTDEEDEDDMVFQSTHPLRGATFSAASGVHHPLAISIHAPLAGRDVPLYGSDKKQSISIHAPLAGRDVQKINQAIEGIEISIHAPLAGRD